MRLAVRSFVICAILVAASAAPLSHPAAHAQPAAAHTQRPIPRAGAVKRTTPPLIVLIVSDQFRGDYVQKYGGMWTKGLRRLIDHGAYFPLAAYPYSYTVTCAGHSTIGTGAFPHRHGMIGNEWYDRATKRSTSCTNDPSVTSVGFGGRTGAEKHSGRWLMTTTFADELRAQSTTPSHVVSISTKPRSAIGMAGHGGDLVLWREAGGTWASSSAYTSAPNPIADAWTQAHPIDAQYGRVWDRLLPAAKYFFTDNGAGEPATPDYPNVFPHAVTRPDGQRDQAFYDKWDRTPFSDEMLADLAIATSGTLGKAAGTDMLAVSFSGLDLVSHRWGPTSHETQDLLLRLDIQIGRLLDTLDARVGANNYVVGFSSDHGAMLNPEQMAAMGIDAGRFTSATINARVTEAWKAAASEDTNPIASGGQTMYFTPAALAAIKAHRAVRDAITAAVLSTPGIGAAYWADELAQPDAKDDAVRKAILLSYVPDRSPDLYIIPKQNWIGVSTGTTHGTPHLYDQRVPVVLMGWGIKPGRYLTTASPADLAPTFAMLAGITLPRAEGRVLAEAIR